MINVSDDGNVSDRFGLHDKKSFDGKFDGPMDKCEIVDHSIEQRIRRCLAHEVNRNDALAGGIMLHAIPWPAFDFLSSFSTQIEISLFWHHLQNFQSTHLLHDITLGSKLSGFPSTLTGCAF